MAVDTCDKIVPNFCGIKKPKIDAACHDLSKEAGKQIMWEVNDITCYCICSCVSQGTPVTIPGDTTIPIEKVVENQTQVLAAGLDLNFVPTTVEKVSGPAYGETKNTIFMTLGFGDGTTQQLVLTMDHPVLVVGNPPTMVSAGRLGLQDQLVDRWGHAVTIKDIQWGNYNGNFFEIGTNMREPLDRKNLTGHLIVTGGVVTGDYMVDLELDLPVSARENKDAPRPVVGSADWRSKNSTKLMTKPARVRNGVFKPAASMRVKVPAHASAFLPEAQAAILEAKAPKQPLDNQYYLEECEWLINKVFKPLYPEVHFLFDWYSDEVNAHSWVGKKTKHVYLSGGLARIEKFEYDGVALAIAHELGHLYGTPTVGGVTCEGEADWYGALVVLRNIWFGEFYFEGTKAAIAQLETLYDYIKAAGSAGAPPKEDKHGQPYPSNKCRIATLQAAMKSPDKPDCANCKPTKRGK